MLPIDHHPVQYQQNQTQSYFTRKNAVKCALLTTVGLGTIYSLSQYLFGLEEGNEEAENSKALALRSIGEVASTTFQALNGITLFGLPFAYAAPIQHHPIENPEDIFQDQIAEIMKAQDQTAEPMMTESINYYLEWGGLPISSCKENSVSFVDAQQNVDHLVEKARSAGHPADRAVLYRMARRSNRGGKFDGGVWENKQENLRIEEVDAGLKAANSARTTSEEIAWLIRTGEALNLPIRFDCYPYEGTRNPFGFLELNEEQQAKEIELGVEIWNRAGELLLKETESFWSESSNYEFTRSSKNLLAKTNVNEIVAARCFYLAGNAHSWGKKAELSKAYYEKAYDTLTDINCTSLSKVEATLVQKEISSVSGYISNEIAVFEKKQTAEAYAELAKDDFKFSHKMNQAIQLYEAAHGVDTLEEMLELFIQARDIFEDLMKQDSHLCRGHALFYVDREYYGQFAGSRLYQIRNSIAGLEEELRKKNSWFSY